MQPDRIVEHLNVVDYITCGLLSALVMAKTDPVGLQPGEEAFHHGIIERIAFAAHAAGDAGLSQKLLEVKAGILGAPDALMFVK